MSTFLELGLSPELQATVTALGYEAPSPIQAAAVPPLFLGRDVLGQAQTGTGKTAAFAWPILERLVLEHRRPQALVLTPTRELAIQVAEAFQTYARHLAGFHVLPVYGGQGMHIQLRRLERGVHVVVGTPGRVMDHLRRGTLLLDGLHTVVLDEADEMLRMGFIEDVEWILGRTPEGHQTALFSATMPSAIRKVANRHLKDPVEVKIEGRTATVASVRQRYCPVKVYYKLEALTRVLEVEDAEATLIFVRTKTSAVELADKLDARGYDSAALHGDMTQPARERVVEDLRNGRLDLVVATDVAARGIDVPRISHVINYDIPYDAEAYIHRIGRTGRAGREGHAIMFVTGREHRMLRAIEHATRQPMERMLLPSTAAITGQRLAEYKALVGETLETVDLAYFRDIVTEIEAERGVTTPEIAAALGYLAQRNRPLRFVDSIPRDVARTMEQATSSPDRERASKGGRSVAPDRAGGPWKKQGARDRNGQGLRDRNGEGACDRRRQGAHDRSGQGVGDRNARGVRDRGWADDRPSGEEASRGRPFARRSIQSEEGSTDAQSKGRGRHDRDSDRGRHDRDSDRGRHDRGSERVALDAGVRRPRSRKGREDRPSKGSSLKRPTPKGRKRPTPRR